MHIISCLLALLKKQRTSFKVVSPLAQIQETYIRVIYAFKTMSCWTVQFSLYSISHSFRIIMGTFIIVF